MFIIATFQTLIIINKYNIDNTNIKINAINNKLSTFLIILYNNYYVIIFLNVII